jgi:hypothetical protein
LKGFFLKTISLPILSSITKNINGLVLYSGPSQLDGKPIVVIAVGFVNKSKNIKTGSMIQTYILVDNDKLPHMNHSSGEDTTVCGDCKHRSKASGGLGSCYVNLGQGPYQIYNRYKQGKYTIANPSLIKEMFTDKLVRIGTYGDPTAAPLFIWENILPYVKGWTGYTHQWKNPKFSAYKKFLMASVDTVSEFKQAKRAGWRSFRVKKPNEKLMKYEFVCPASKEGGQRLNCNTCLACNGNKTGKNKSSVVINAHGLSYKINRFLKRK